MRARSRHFQSAFTLIEVLVSLAVLLMVVGLVAELTNNAAQVSTFGRNRMDTDSQARLIFDRMASDIGEMCKRKDVDCVLAKLDGGNDALFFFAEAPSFFLQTPATKALSR
jgi:prepilin-type N-terminal cleavage/methylation domain-containing protein